MNIWWVNQGGTYELSKRLGYLWAPLKTYWGREHAYWSTMAEVRKGDIIAHYSKGKILALSRATADVYIAERVSGFHGLQSEAWTASLGRRVDITLFPLEPPILIDSVAARIHELAIYQGPLTKNGKIKQSYLNRFTLDGLRILQEAALCEFPEWAILQSHSSIS